MKDKLFSKIVNKDYNNRLEEVLSQKNFSEDVKNSLLSIFYKIENGYNDYTKVKKETIEKNIYIEFLINIIENECNNIIFLKNNDDKEIVDTNKKEIKCFPIPNNILYCLSEMRNNNNQINYLDNNIDNSISFILNMGYSINFVEPLRDFNGFSWNINLNDIQDIKCNLIYQNFLFILGNDYLEHWINVANDNNDYFELFRKNVELKYGKDFCERISFTVSHLAILIKSNLDNSFRKSIIKEFNEIKTQLNKMDDKEQYLSEISKIKKSKQKEIRNLDKIINDKELLKIEYEKKNNNVSKEKKIFSPRVLKNILIEERKEKIADIEKLNKKMDPKYYFKLREYLKNIQNIININDYKDINKQIEDFLIKLQKDIIKSMCIEIQNIDTKEQLINYMYIYRYYILLPFSNNKCICDILELKDNLNELSTLLFNKAIKFKVIVKIYEDLEENVNLLKQIFNTKIICLENIYIKISDNKTLTIYDEEIEDNEINLNKEKKDLLKNNKKIKLFM